MMHELNAEVTRKHGYSIRLFSNYPFPHRKDGGPRDRFEEEALRDLTDNPTGEFCAAKRSMASPPSATPAPTSWYRPARQLPQ